MIGRSPTPADVRGDPRVSARGPELAAFAHTYDAYRHFGDSWGERLNEARKRWEETGELPDDLGDLRALLFLEHPRERFVYIGIKLVEGDHG